MLNKIIQNDMEKYVHKIKKYFTEASLLDFSEASVKDLEKYNFGLGTMIRLKILTPKSHLTKKLSRNGFNDRDKISMEMIKEFHKYMHCQTGQSIKD